MTTVHALRPNSICNNLVYESLKHLLVFSFVILIESQTANLSNKLIRFVMGKHNRSHVGTAEFKDINWLPVEQRVA